MTLDPQKRDDILWAIATLVLLFLILYLFLNGGAAPTPGLSVTTGYAA